MNKFFNILYVALVFVSYGANAEFISEDPALGNANNAPSLHRYLYAYQNPTVYIDPDGRTAQQFQAAMHVAVDAFRSSGNRTALGTAGEVTLERILVANNEIIIKGPGTSPGAHNADLVSFNPETKQISFFDNKIQTLKAGVSRANNLSHSAGRGKSIAEAMRNVNELDLSPQVRRDITKSLSKVELDHSKAIWAVANASPSELSEVNNKVKRVSKRLVDKGVRFADVTNGKIKILSGADSHTNGKKILGKVGKAIPVAGTAVSAALATSRLSAASNDDAAFRQTMQSLGVGNTVFDNHSFQRESAIIAGEEAGGEGGGAGAAAAASVPSAGCGPAYLLCVGAAALTGGLAGDAIGGHVARRSFDAISERNYAQEIERIRNARSKKAFIITENQSGLSPKKRVME